MANRLLLIVITVHNSRSLSARHDTSTRARAHQHPIRKRHGVQQKECLSSSETTGLYFQHVIYLTAGIAPRNGVESPADAAVSVERHSRGATDIKVLPFFSHGPKSSPGGALSEKRGGFTSSWCIPFSRSKPSCRLCFAQRPRFTFALRAVGRVSFSSRRHARLPSPKFTYSPSAVHGCAGRAPHAAVHGHGHARVFMEAYDVREPFICYDDGVCSRATNPMDPFASADCLMSDCIVSHRVQIRRAPRC